MILMFFKTLIELKIEPAKRERSFSRNIDE